MTELSDPGNAQRIVVQNENGRVITMDSMTYVDHRNFNCDVLIAASYFGAMPVRQWVLPASPKGVIAHAAGEGRNMAGVSGLWALEAADIPGAATETHSCRISDGTDLYENGMISHLNAGARKLGITEGMSAKTAAQLMLGRCRRLAEAPPSIEIVHQSERGNIVALGSVSFITDDNAGDVICAGSNFSLASAAYSAPFDVRGVICNDAGRCKDDSGINGLNVVEERGIAAATVSTDSAEIGDGLSTYRDGIVSALNDTARKLGVLEGISAKEAALLMLDRT